jgi:selenocysteine lyase/cysteine desulfurase
MEYSLDDLLKVFDTNDITTDYYTFLNNNRYNNNTVIKTPFYNKIKITYCDQTASAFPLKYVEEKLQKYAYPYYSNTHSNNFLGRTMTHLINYTKSIINKSYNLNNDDRIIFTGTGCSGAINHLIHLIAPKLKNSVVFVSTLEHYSNYLPWYHNAEKLVVLDIDENGLINIKQYKELIKLYSKLNKNIIVSLTGASNITGVVQDIYELARICHKYNGIIFIDLATFAPYLPINIHHNDEIGEYLDGCFISPHKFPGGTSTPGILIVNKNIICNKLTFTPSGGTVRFVEKNSKPIYSDNIEVKENGGTPNIIGIIKIGIVLNIKNKFQNEILEHEQKLTLLFNNQINSIKKKYNNLILLYPNNNIKLPIFPIQIKPYHYNLIVSILCDKYGIVTRGGTNCSGIYAEKLLNLSEKEKHVIKQNILNDKGVHPSYGWIRITLSSIHSIDDVIFICKSIEKICKNISLIEKYYYYDPIKNVYFSNLCNDGICSKVII